MMPTNPNIKQFIALDSRIQKQIILAKTLIENIYLDPIYM
jgi:hypothetical protein